MNMRIFVICLLVFAFGKECMASDLVLRTKVASALGRVVLFPDSSYLKPSSLTFEEGTLFKILGETALDHEDDAQNQKFKWYKVEAPNGKSGWVFGDGLAVILPDKQVPDMLRPYHKHRFAFNNGFEQSIIWVGALEGRDNFHKQDLLNPIYNEQYIIITNEQGRSVHIQYAAQSARGSDRLRHFQLYDLSGDDVPELIVQLSGQPVGSQVENRNLSIFAFQAGTLENVFNERMTLTYQHNQASPALFKSIEIDGDLLRVEYIDYVPCGQYSLSHRCDSHDDKKERCLEFVTYTYLWDDRSRQLAPFYKE
ncbi:MAG: SH3 domain-containing protein, partial [Bacteroidota bacterium]